MDWLELLHAIHCWHFSGFIPDLEIVIFKAGIFGGYSWIGEARCIAENNNHAVWGGDGIEELHDLIPIGFAIDDFAIIVIIGHNAACGWGGLLDIAGEVVAAWWD